MNKFVSGTKYVVKTALSDAAKLALGGILALAALAGVNAAAATSDPVAGTATVSPEDVQKVLYARWLVDSYEAYKDYCDNLPMKTGSDGKTYSPTAEDKAGCLQDVGNKFGFKLPGDQPR